VFKHLFADNQEVLYIKQFEYTGLVKIMLTLMDRMDRIRTVVLSVPREMCVRPVNGTVAGWLLCVKQDSKQVETVL
jgi:hypothetical protein